MNRSLLLGLAPAALALAAAAAFAQPPGPGPGGPGVRTMMIHRGGPGHDMGPEMKAMHEAMMKQHMEDLKTVLRLRPDQEPALKAFLESHGPGGMSGGPTIIMRREGDPDGKPGEMMAPPKPMTTPERLADMAKHEEMMAAEMKTRRDALAKFYAALSPDQQKVFDALQRLHGPGHGMGGPGMRRIEIRRGPGGPPMPGHEPD
jgi:Spy/CpxP family protein refolding chaperone